MVKGIEKFREFFGAYPDNYVVIGGTACDILISDAGLRPRATKDIDIMIIVEAINPDFVSRFWDFVKAAKYEKRETGSKERKYYRFSKPENPEYPYQVELFSRKPDVITLEKDAHLTIIPADNDLSSLSAILLNDEYYNFIVKGSSINGGIRMADVESLICLKAKAYLEIAERIAAGVKEDEKHLRKHKADVFRLAVLTSSGLKYTLPDSIKKDLQSFIDEISENLPDKAVISEMGAGNIDVSDNGNYVFSCEYDLFFANEYTSFLNKIYDSNSDSTNLPEIIFINGDSNFVSRKLVVIFYFEMDSNSGCFNKINSWKNLFKRLRDLLNYYEELKKRSLCLFLIII